MNDENPNFLVRQNPLSYTICILQRIFILGSTKAIFLTGEILRDMTPETAVLLTLFFKTSSEKLQTTGDRDG